MAQDGRCGGDTGNRRGGATRRHCAVALALALLGIAAPAPAEPYAVGDRIEPFTLADQHGDPHELDESVRVILLNRDMDAGKIVKAALEGVDAAALRERNAVYVADIHRMPGLVAKMFALPSMRRRPYPMWLDREGTISARLPGAEGRATAIFVEALAIRRVLHFDDADALRRELGLDDAEGTQP